MENIFNFEFKQPKKQNAPSYRDIRAGYSNGTIDPIVYFLMPKDEGDMLSGDGVLEMQKRLATVFRVFKPELFKKYFKFNLSTSIEPADNKLFNAVTNGEYNIRTMEMVMDFQKSYMYKFRSESNQIPVKGFGSFGGYTKRELDNWYGKALKNIKDKKIDIKGPMKTLFKG